MKLLERHRARREQNLPTISCFVGAIEEARSSFAAHHELLVVEGDEVAREYALQLASARPLWRDALELLARKTGRARSVLEGELSAKTAHERATLFRTIDLPKEIETLIDAWCEGRAHPELDLTQLARIIPRGEWPALFAPRPSDRALVMMARLVEELPFLAAAAVIEESQLERAPERVRALLREGLILLRDEARARALAGVRDATEPEQAKSAAELFLFEVLEATPDLRGLFVLNHRMDFPFGHAAAEIDLAAASRRIAVEIDGYFHFRDVDAYRRDRRKDLLLQTHGWLVLRFLAEDVVARLEETLSTIRRAMTLRPGEIDS